MAAKNWSDEQVALIEHLEELLFRDDVATVTVTGDAPVTVQTTDSKSIAPEAELVIPEAMLRELVNELLLPYTERKPQPKGSKSGNPAKRAAENKALGLDAVQATRVKGTTVQHEATLQLPHSTDKTRALRVHLRSQWPPSVPTPTIAFTKLG